MRSRLLFARLAPSACAHPSPAASETRPMTARRLSLLAHLGLTLAVLVGLAAPASAYTCPRCPNLRGIIESVADTSERNINNHVSMEVGLTLAALGDMTEQISRILLKQIETEEAMRTAEQKQDTRTEREVQEFEAKQIFNRQPRSACVTATGTNALPGGQRIRRQMQQVMNQSAMIYDRNAAAETATTEVAAASARLATRRELYCSEADAARGLCDSPVEERLQNADINAGTLMDNGTLDPDMQRAAQEFCTNFTRPVPPRALSGAGADTAAGEIVAIRRISYDSRVSLARQVCHQMIAQQTQTMDLNEWAEAVEVDAESLNAEADGISVYDLIRIEVTRRYGNPNWVTETLGRDALPVNLQKEIAMMIGLSLFLDWERYEMERRMAANMAALVASQSTRDYYQGGTTSAGLGIGQINSGR